MSAHPLPKLSAPDSHLPFGTWMEAVCEFTPYVLARGEG
jgi:hypothetical protein